MVLVMKLWELDKKIYAYVAGTSQDITPIRSTEALVNAISTTLSSDIITITDTTHGAIQGDFVTLSSVSTDVGGIPAATLDGEYEILSISNVNAYTIQSSATATSSVGPTANCTATYQLNIGPSIQTFGYGWGQDLGCFYLGNTRSTSSVILMHGYGLLIIGVKI